MITRRLRCKIVLNNDLRAIFVPALRGRRSVGWRATPRFPLRSLMRTKCPPWAIIDQPLRGRCARSVARPLGAREPGARAEGHYRFTDSPPISSLHLQPWISQAIIHERPLAPCCGPLPRRTRRRRSWLAGTAPCEALRCGFENGRAVNRGLSQFNYRLIPN
jgi:hypothetical protein